jgi:glycosyltransferase involved in cell wall biosynthesis
VRPTFLHVVLNEFTHDARVLRAARLGVEMGGRVVVLAMGGTDLPAGESAGGIEVRRFHLFTRPLPKTRPWQMLKYAELGTRAAAAGARLRPALVHAHDLNALPIGWTVAGLSGAALLYDSHELWSDRSPGAGRPGWFQRGGGAAERFLGRRADAVITVSNGLARLITENTGVPVTAVVRNFSERAQARSDGEAEPGAGGRPPAATGGPEASPLRRALGAGPDEAVLLYQGGLHPGRGLPLLLDAMARLPRGRATLAFLGPGPLRPDLEARASELGLGEDVRFLDAVPPGELADWTRGATIGIHPIEDLSLNHRYCLPNKLFEYIQAGLPVLVSDLPEMRAVVEGYGVGECFPAGDAEALAERVRDLIGEPERLAAYRVRALQAGAELSWEREKEKLARLYRRLLEGDAEA